MTLSISNKKPPNIDDFEWVKNDADEFVIIQSAEDIPEAMSFSRQHIYQNIRSLSDLQKDSLIDSILQKKDLVFTWKDVVKLELIAEACELGFLPTPVTPISILFVVAYRLDKATQEQFNLMAIRISTNHFYRWAQ